MIDFLIVGSGLAGISFAEVALQNNKTILVFDNQSRSSSNVAAGLYNPVVLKRFSEVWNAKELLAIAIPFYQSLAQKFNFNFDFKLPIYRRFASVEEQNNWFFASDKLNLNSFLFPSLITDDIPYVTSNFGFGKVLETGFIDVNALISHYKDYLIQCNAYISSNFDYSQILFNEDFILYGDYKIKHVIFAEGFGLNSNPFFNQLPLDGTKGELLIIKAPCLQLDVILMSNIFIIPLGNSLFKVGATYNWHDKTTNTTQYARNELIESLKDLISCDFEVVDHLAGIRPTVKDRRPLVGTHFQHKRLHVLNGLGTRGVLLAPYLASQLFKSIAENTPLENEINIQRVYNKLK
ncbi:MAG TPA: FAD-dependent oxidoreductase [Flavobacterium sp.]|nr:FAD-dependent oxidoreductase [Flavobacterium sp.]